MKTLFLDIASHTSVVACVADSVCGVVESSDRIGDAQLIPMVESALKAAGWEYSDIERIACVVGPGGFTSLRVAVTFANVLADQLGVPVVGVHMYELYRERTRTRADVYWLHSTKKDQLFVCGGQWKEPTLITIDALRSTLSAIHYPFLWCGELIDDHRAIVESDSISLPSAVDVLPAFLETLSYTKESLEPWYGRGW